MLETDPFKFGVGQIVRYLTFESRAVIFDADPWCRTDSGLYATQFSGPDPDQPWYHLLVEGSSLVTYAAQTSIEPEFCLDPIRHPLLRHFFRAYFEGRYYQENLN